MAEVIRAKPVGNIGLFRAVEPHMVASGHPESEPAPESDPAPESNPAPESDPAP